MSGALVVVRTAQLKLEKQGPGKIFLERFGQSGYKKYAATFPTTIYYIGWAQIAQGEISMSVAFPTHVWKMPNICKYIIVWLFSHMCAFSRTYVLKSKHVWKNIPTCLVFSKHVG